MTSAPHNKKTVQTREGQTSARFSRQAAVQRAAQTRAQQAQHYQQMRRRNQRMRRAWTAVAVGVALICLGAAFAFARVVGEYARFWTADTNLGLPAQTNSTPKTQADSTTKTAMDAAKQKASRDEQNPTITLTMVGDVLVHKGVWQSGEADDGSRNYDHLFAQVAPELKAADVAIVNQETILAGSEFPLSGYPSFNSPQEVGDAEVACGVDLIAHASNHSTDLGSKGVAADLAYWRRAHPNIAVIGISDVVGKPNSYWLYEKNGFKLGFVNATYGTNQGRLPQDNPSAVRILSEAQLQEDIASLRRQGADAIVCIPHWGEEYHTDVSPYQKEMAAHMANFGVDVIIGAHPHVIEPVETITSDSGHKTLVFWSLGNFVSTQAQAHCMIGGMATVVLSKHKAGAASDTISVKSYTLTPVICQRNVGHDMTVYKLSDYTDELAAANGINTVDKNVLFTREWCLDYCESVLGPSFNRESAVLEQNVSD